MNVEGGEEEWPISPRSFLDNDGGRERNDGRKDEEEERRGREEGREGEEDEFDEFKAAQSLPFPLPFPGPPNNLFQPISSARGQKRTINSPVWG